MSKYFVDIKIGEQFYCNGNNWIKKSNRTAKILNFPVARTYYFKMFQQVNLPKQ